MLFPSPLSLANTLMHFVYSTIPASVRLEVRDLLDMSPGLILIHIDVYLQVSLLNFKKYE